MPFPGPGSSGSGSGAPPSPPTKRRQRISFSPSTGSYATRMALSKRRATTRQSRSTASFERSSRVRGGSCSPWPRAPASPSWPPRSSGQPEADPLDLLVHVAWNAPLRTRRERAEEVLRGNDALFEKYTPAAREVLRDLLTKYAEHGPSQLHDLRVLEVDPLARHGSPVEIAGLFGGADGLRVAVSELEEAIYAA
jgi:hypothetical protein